MFINTVKSLLEEALTERKDLFLIDFSVNGENAINIIIDVYYLILFVLFFDSINILLSYYLIRLLHSYNIRFLY